MANLERGADTELAWEAAVGDGSGAAEERRSEWEIPNEGKARIVRETTGSGVRLGDVAPSTVRSRIGRASSRLCGGGSSGASVSGPNAIGPARFCLRCGGDRGRDNAGASAVAG